MSNGITVEDLQKMDPVKLLQMVEEVCLSNGRAKLAAIMDSLITNPELPLEGNNSVTASAPVPVPFGVLKERPDLGDLGVLITITYSLESLKPYEAQAKAGAAIADLKG